MKRPIVKLAVLPIAISAIALCVISYAAPASTEPENFLYTNSSDLRRIQNELNRPDIAGVQIVYNWKDLEPEKDKYDFGAIERDLRFLTARHKKLFIQVQDRFFLPDAKNVPGYLMKDPIYDGGIVPQYDHQGEGKPVTMGWATEQWNPNVRKRYQKLLQSLAKQFDGKVYGVNLPETAIDINTERDKTGFSCDKYFNAEIENVGLAKRAFQKSYVVQYVNFWPCEWNNDHNYMGRLFAYAVENNIGLGGPDIVPYRKGQMKNSYPFFHRYKDRLVLIAMAVQEPTLTYINPRTKKRFTKEEFQEFAKNYLGAKIVFWTTSAPWLKHP
ncbi:MAG: hypothetical protein ACRD4P_16860 [Bryobacteraceae bacterium]